MSLKDYADIVPDGQKKYSIDEYCNFGLTVILLFIEKRRIGYNKFKSKLKSWFIHGQS